MKPATFRTNPVILALLVAAGVALNAYFSRPSLPTRLPDGRIPLESAELRRPEMSRWGDRLHWDYWHYLAMAEKPFSKGLARYSHQSWRVLTPTVVHVLPVPREKGFYLVGLFATALAGFLLYFFFENALGSAAAGYAGVLTYYCWALGSAMALSRVYYLEITTFPFMVLGLYAMDRRKYGLFFAALWIGVLQREIVMVLGPVLLVREWAAGERSPARLARLAVPALVVPAAIFLAVRAALPLEHSPLAGMVRHVWTRDYAECLAHPTANFFYWLLLRPWGIPGLVAVTFGVVFTARALARRPHYLFFSALVYASLGLGKAPDRYLVYAAPVVLVCYLETLRGLFPGARVRAAVFAALTALELMWTWHVALHAAAWRGRTLVAAAAAVLALGLACSRLSRRVDLSTQKS